MTSISLPFADVHLREDAADVRAAIERVLSRGWFVLGPEVEAFETEFAAASAAPYAVGVANGTDAIALLLRAADIGPGDEVLVPAMTAAFTALAVTMVGGTPVIVDVEPGTLTIDPEQCAAAITSRTRAIVPVHLYGQGAALEPIRALAQRHALAVIEDCCQAHLATAQGAPVGTTTLGGAFSFYPTKNLGCLGDGGAIVTRDPGVAGRVRRLRNGGQEARYEHVEPGVNSRLDEVQAAILRARLPFLPAWTARRRELAAAYRRLLPPDLVAIEHRDAGHVYHLFPVRHPRRDDLRAHLAAAGIGTLVHYPVPLSAQPAFGAFRPAPCPVADAAARQLLSLPLHPGMTTTDVARVADAAAAFVKGHPPA